MSQEIIKQKIASLFPLATFNDNSQFVEVVLPKNVWLASAFKFKNELGFDFLLSLTGVDYPESLSIVCHIRSTTTADQIVVKIHDADKANALIDSVTPVWAAAEFFEREVYDLLSIKFTNHPDLRRIFLEDDYVGYPLRKDFVDEINIIER